MPREKLPTAFDAYLHVAGTISIGLDGFLRDNPPIVKSRRAWAKDILKDVNTLNKALKFLRERDPKLKKDLNYVKIAEELAVGFTYAQQAVREYAESNLTKNDMGNYMGLQMKATRVYNDIMILTGKSLLDYVQK